MIALALTPAAAKIIVWFSIGVLIGLLIVFTVKELN